MNPKILSFDAETDGLWGPVVAIGATVYYNDTLQDRFFGYLGEQFFKKPHVREVILPALVNEQATHTAVVDLYESFAQFYRKHKYGCEVVTYIGYPIEMQILKDMKNLGLLDDDNLAYPLTPFPVIDVATLLMAHGLDRFMDPYVEKHALLEGRPEVAGLIKHHPVYDSAAAAMVYHHLNQQKIAL